MSWEKILKQSEDPFDDYSFEQIQSRREDDEFTREDAEVNLEDAEGMLKFFEKEGERTLENLSLMLYQIKEVGVKSLDDLRDSTVYAKVIESVKKLVEEAKRDLDKFKGD